MLDVASTPHLIQDLPPIHLLTVSLLSDELPVLPMVLRVSLCLNSTRTSLPSSLYLSRGPPSLIPLLLLLYVLIHRTTIYLTMFKTYISFLSFSNQPHTTDSTISSFSFPSCLLSTLLPTPYLPWRKEGRSAMHYVVLSNTRASESTHSLKHNSG